MEVLIACCVLVFENTIFGMYCVHRLCECRGEWGKSGGK